MKQRRTILFLVKLYHPHIGGVEKHLEELIKVLKKKDFDITIITERYDRNLKSSELYRGVQIFRIPVTKSAFFKKFSIWKWVFFHYSLFQKADIIHAHDVFFWILPIRPMLFYKKVYTTFHGYEGYPVKMKWIAVRKVSEMLSNGSICVGEFMKRWYSAKPSSIIYGGVRLSKKNKLPKPATAVFFGRLDDQTGIIEYCNAYRLIKKEFPNFRLTIVGEGALSKKIPKDIKIIPFVKDIEPFLLENEFIFVSRYLSMLEALASKREIVAVYDNPIKRDYLTMSPFKKYIHISNDSAGIADFINTRLRKRQPKNPSLEDGYRWAQSQTWEKIADTYINLWK